MCNLHCKGLTIDLEAEFPDKSTISVFYFDQVQNFSMKEMLDGIERDHVCDVIFYSKEQVFNGSIIYTSTQIKEPINTVISLGICVPSVDKSAVIGGDFSTFFTINLKHIG